VLDCPAVLNKVEKDAKYHKILFQLNHNKKHIKTFFTLMPQHYTDQASSLAVKTFQIKHLISQHVCVADS